MIGFFPKEMKKGEKNSILNFFKFFVAPHKFFCGTTKRQTFFSGTKYKPMVLKKAVIFFFLPTFVANEVRIHF